MNLNKIGSVKNRNILFLQGPMGQFFKNLEKMFLAKDANTFRIGLNVGDYFYALKHSYVPYRGTPDAWPDFIMAFLQEHNIEMIMLFGDCRYYQATAIYAAKNLGLEVFVFEEGYIRPDYITMERYGVNDYSLIPKEAQFYEQIDLLELTKPRSTESSTLKRQVSAITYYLLADFMSWRYPNYKHHRDLNAVLEFYLGWRSAFRKIIYAYKERGLLHKIKTTYANNYFFVPLQTHNDFQILQHSYYRSVETFIEDVLVSFSQHALTENMLVFKHHPVDRGRKDYSDFICQKAKELGIDMKRILVVHDVHLPTLLKNAIGTITINSTVGLSSLHHNTPTVAMGNAIYGFQGLSYGAEDLDVFWKDREPVNQELYLRFRQYLIVNTQINGSFYGKFFLDDVVESTD